MAIDDPRLRELEEKNALLETRVKHLTNDLHLTREENEASLVRYLDIHTNLEKKVAERTAELARTNQTLQNEILERRRAETRLQQSQKMKAIGTLAGGIAHDFNNILAAIMGYTEMSLMDTDEASSVHRRLTNVLKATNRAKELIHQILTFSRQNDPEIRPMAPLPIIKETIKMMRASLPATVEIRQRIPASSAMIMADPDHIHQILMNLCTNASQAMAKNGGTLELRMTEVDFDTETAHRDQDLLPGKYLKLTVADTGRGMDRAELEQIFDPYFTTKQTVDGDGSGLGLSVVHGIIHSHGGTIAVNSELGTGTTVDVFFPIIEPAKTDPAAVKTPIPLGRERILFVDDEQALADVGLQMLQRLGYHVVPRTSSVEALEAFRAHPDRFDLVVTDQTMPNMTGTELAREIHRIRPDIPIILCTGFSEKFPGELGPGIGIDDFLFKPIALRDFADTIRRVLDQPHISMTS
ncbi:MAG: response regulator [Desulfobacterales bacterium]|nr:response regulator [Desulfobacterales bacterium]